MDAAVKTEREKKAEAYDRLKKAGICVRCARRPADSGVLCRVDREANRRKWHLWRKKCRAGGKCVNCERKPMSGHIRCSFHRKIYKNKLYGLFGKCSKGRFRKAGK